MTEQTNRTRGTNKLPLCYCCGSDGSRGRESFPKKKKKKTESERERERERASTYHVSIVGEVYPERISRSAALGVEVSHPVPEEVGFTRVRNLIPVRQLRFEHGIGQAAGQP